MKAVKKQVVEVEIEVVRADKPKEKRTRKQLNVIHFVQEDYLYKLCTNCDTIRHIGEFSRTAEKDNLTYSHRKCKICRSAIECVKQKEKYHKKKKEQELMEDLP